MVALLNMEDGGGINRGYQGTAYTSSLASPAQSSHMRIGIIGSGKMGTGLGRLWAKSGHNVMFSYSRRPESLKDPGQEVGSHARPAHLKRRFGLGMFYLSQLPDFRGAGSLKITSPQTY